MVGDPFDFAGHSQRNTDPLDTDYIGVQYGEYKALLRVVRAANYIVAHVKHKAMCPGIKELDEALEALPEGMLDE